MKVVFISNFFNHHQAFLAKELDVLTNHNFTFIETMPINEERKKMGWGKETLPDYVFQAFKSKEAQEQAKKMIYGADAVIWGDCPFSYIKTRLQAKKLTFDYSERIFKTGSRVGTLLRGLKYYFRLFKYQKNHYLLCASAYAASDYNKLRLFRGRCYRWGYFPELKEYTDIHELLEGKEENSILWVSRMITWKHPEIPIEVARRLKQEGYNFIMHMIGTGELEEETKDKIRREKLEDCIKLTSTMSPQEVRKTMEKSKIFLFTSDQNEGWGAVLNESMNSACAVVANEAIGSVPYLINKENGCFYQNGNVEELYEKTKYLIDHSEDATHYGRNAYFTIKEEWNAKTAAERLIQTINLIVDGLQPTWDKGPLSII